MDYCNKIIIKNGKECYLKSCSAKDGEEVLAGFLAMRSETDYLLTYVDENSFTIEREAEFLQAKFESKNEIEIGAFVDGKLVGTAGISSVGAYFKIKHRADFGISVLKEYWGLGIGGALTDACVECARKAGYTQLELSVVSENESAVALYKKKGFIEYGRNPRGFNSRYSGYQELIMMSMEL